MAEFSKRIGDMENKYETVRKERDALKRSQDENALRREITKLGDTLASKQRDLDKARAESDALGKRLTASESELKRLLSEKKLWDGQVASLSEKLSAASALAEARAERIAQLELQEKRSSDALEGFRDVSEANAKSQERWERRVAELTTQKTDLEAALEKAWRDIAEGKKRHAQETEALEAELCERTARMQAEQRQQLAQARKEAAQREEELAGVAAELRAALQRASDDAAWKEEEHAREVRELQKRTEAMEARGDAMASHALDSTLPLLRQIEALQQASSARAQACDDMERRLRAQLRDAEVSLAEAMALNSAADVKAKSLASRCAELEAEAVAKKAALDDSVRAAEAKDAALKALGAAHAAAQAELAAATARVAELKAEYDELNSRHKSLLTSSKTLSNIVTSSSPLLPQSSQSSASSSAAASLAASPALRPVISGSNGSNSGSNGGGGGESGATAAGLLSQASQIERLNSIVAKKESELTAVNEQLASLSSSKQALQMEVVKLSEKVSALEGKLVQYADVEKRYTASLVLLGEQKELVQELKLDIDDMKANYRFQLAQLAQENEELRKKEKKKKK